MEGLWVLMGPQSLFNWNLSINILLYSLDEQTHLTHIGLCSTHRLGFHFFRLGVSCWRLHFPKGYGKPPNTQATKLICYTF